MSSPFPGMDPYLERPDRWSGVHARLIAVIGEALARQVAPRFFVDSEDNVYILGLDDPARSLVGPDIYVVEPAGAASLSRPRGQIAAPMVLEGSGQPRLCFISAPERRRQPAELQRRGAEARSTDPIDDPKVGVWLHGLIGHLGHIVLAMADAAEGVEIQLHFAGAE